jgi:peptidyl-tRNA hydrolase, PTH1 family
LGIGNPGSRYKNNRHNIGFMFLDNLAQKYSLSFSPSKSDYYLAKGNLEEKDFSLIKPTTFVNNIGIAALGAVETYKIDFKDFLVIVDDINLDVSSYRVRASGGDGGHNGLSSIIYHLQTDQFPRIRIGIGNDFEKGSMADYVLSDFREDELKSLTDVFDQCTILVDDFIKGGIDKMLDTHSNTKN